MGTVCSEYLDRFHLGDCHIHTNYTDGSNTVYEMCDEAKKNGLKIIVFSEHVKKDLSYNYDDLFLDILDSREIFDDLILLAGCEAKVLNLNGELDVPIKVLNNCNVVTAVFHSFEYKSKACYLKALESMLKNPLVDIWGHPTLFAKKNAITLDEPDIENIVDLCIENDILIEINSKYSLPDIDFLKIAMRKKARFAFGSDAHNKNEMLSSQKLGEIQKWIHKMC